VPGGKAVYPSSVVMNVVPAQVAGVGEVALASPPQADAAAGCTRHPRRARLLGVTEVYAMGGAGAVGAYAYGVDSSAWSPSTSSPARQQLRRGRQARRRRARRNGFEAGATEILIVADEHADAALVAVDLISQAEHDEQASAVLVTWSQELADRVRAEVVERVYAPATRARDAALDGPQSAIVWSTIAAATAFSNAYAPEHLELHLRDPRPEDFVNAGAVFVGAYSPVSLGDYLAGSNHVLPTGGQPRYAAGLSAATFLRPQQVIVYDREALRAAHDDIVALAVAEALPAHGEAVTARSRTSRRGVTRALPVLPSRRFARDRFPYQR
jgi:histidinol dehydrogenase